MTIDRQACETRLNQLLGYLKQDPGNASLRADTFDAALAAGNFTEAGYQVAHALHANPSDVNWLRKEALLQLAQGRYRQAESLYASLIANGDGDAVTHFNLAYARFGAGDHAVAREALESLREEPTDLGAMAWALWLRCEHHLGKLDEGLQAFRTVLAGRVMPIEAWGVASLMAFDNLLVADARTWADHALKGDPDQMEALVTMGSLALAKLDVKGATALLERALQVNPKDGRSWSGLAFTRFLNLDLPGARTAFKTSLEFMPGHIGTWIGYGWCEFLSKDIQAAHAAFEKALELDPAFGESHGAVAITLASLGETERARKEIDIALKLDSRSLSTRYAQTLLRGEAKDPAAFFRMMLGALGQHPSPLEGDEGRTLADVVLRYRR